jgi:predicted DNA-binding transcriptional regulator YafY
LDRTERIYKIQKMLRQIRVVKFSDFQEALEVSRATLNRDLEYLRSRLRLPVIYNRDAGGYLLDEAGAHRGESHELPGLWFTSTAFLLIHF